VNGSDYPVRLEFAPDEGQNRLWGIPLVGLIVRAILVIPHAIILTFASLVVYLLVFINWIPVLLNGRMAGWGYTIFGGYLRLYMRVAAYTTLITGRYPPFGFGGDHTVTVEFDENQTQSRLWGIPLVGLFVRLILLIPHWIVLAIYGVVAGILILFTWVPVLLNGRTSDWVVRYVGGYFRWLLRVTAYWLLLTGRYPPFSID
jgi:small-conductance mechanosensitive channel